MYVPVKKSSAVISVTLVIQQFCVDTGEFNLQYFTVPISVKANDHLKMLDMRLHERLSFNFNNAIFSSNENVNPAIFDDTKILYLAGSLTKERTYEVGIGRLILILVYSTHNGSITFRVYFKIKFYYFRVHCSHFGLVFI